MTYGKYDRVRIADPEGKDQTVSIVRASDGGSYIAATGDGKHITIHTDDIKGLA